MRSSKLKKRRNKKKRRSPSPAKGGPRRHSQGDEDDEIGNDLSHESVEKAQKVADAIKGHVARKHTKTGTSYQPLEQTRSDMSAGARERLQGSIAAILGGAKKKF